jgi:TRAP-type C4-dicarboxylate transport system permease small subunit
MAGAQGRGGRGLPMIDTMLRGVRGLVAMLRAVAGVLLVLSVALNFANVVGRYFFGKSIFWAEEVMLFLMVGCVFLGNGVVAWSGRQIRMDVIVGMMSERARQALDLIAELVLIVTAIMIIVFAWPVIKALWEFDQRSQSADVPLYIPQVLVPIGFGLMAFLVIVRLLTGGDRDPSARSDH